MTTTLDRSYLSFIKNLQKNSIENYFGIKPHDNSKINITISNIVDNNMVLNIRFIKREDFYNLNNLPMEIIKIIHSYGNYYIDITLNILFPEQYPFDRPIWSLSKISHNIELQQPLEIEDYYKYLIQNHNNPPERYWSHTSIEKDILEFIQKINHFEFLLYTGINI